MIQLENCMWIAQKGLTFFAHLVDFPFLDLNKTQSIWMSLPLLVQQITTTDCWFIDGVCIS